MDYKKIGLKCGIEVHNQLNTDNKLFCKCNTKMSGEKPLVKIFRKQHPVASELGEYDIATKYEVMRNRSFGYESFKDETCNVELDEEPPHKLNMEALEVALTVSILLNCKIVDEVHVMRKNVIDGSNTTSFQRTMVIGMDGFLNYNGKKIPIDQVSLEEDASAIIGKENGIVKYKLNRLGIPLIEIATGLLEEFTPEEVQDISFNLGMVIRSTGKAKKTLGAIRQDINVSIKDGARNEIKGIQELSMLSKSIKNEITRQLSIIQLKKHLEKLNVKKIHDNPISVTSIISDTENKILKNIIEKNGNIFAIILPKFKGLFKREIFQGKTLGKEFSDVAIEFGLKGLFHNDEDLSKYGLELDFKKIKENLKIKDDDLIILTGEIETHGKVALEVLERARQLLKGVQKGTRSSLPNGLTKYNRPLAGAKRMYPESDIIPITITEDLKMKLKNNLPEPINKKIERIKKEYNISNDLTTQIIKLDISEFFEELFKKTKANPKIIANTLVSTSKNIEKRYNVNVKNIKDSHYFDIFNLIGNGELLKESIPEIIIYLSKNPSENVKNCIKNIGIKKLSINEIEEIVKKTLLEVDNKKRSVGIIMSKLRGKSDIKTILEIIKRFENK